MKRVQVSVRSEGNASQPQETVDSATVPISCASNSRKGVPEKLTRARDAYELKRHVDDLSPYDHDFIFTFSAPYSNLMYPVLSYPYSIQLIFDDADLEFSISSKKFAFSAFDLANYLHTVHELNEFDLIRSGSAFYNSLHGNLLSPKCTIRDADIIHISGFDQWLSTQWNKLMHSINGNMENDRDSERDHLPVVKDGEKSKKCAAQSKLNKKMPQHRSDARAKNKRGQFIFGKKNIAPKVFVERSPTELAALAAKGDNIDLDTGHVDKPANGIVPPIIPPFSSPSGFPLPVPPLDDGKKEKEKEVVKTLPDDFELGQLRYSYEYVFSDEGPTKVSSNQCYWFGFIPKFSWVSIGPESPFYYFPSFLLFLFSIWVLVDPIFTPDFFKSVVAKGTNFNVFSFHNNLVESSTSSFLYYRIYMPLSYILLLMLQNFMVSESALTACNVFLFLFTRTVFIFGMYKFNSSFYRKFSLIMGYPRRLIPVRPYYTRRIEITDSVDVCAPDPKLDMRIESDKNFKVTQGRRQHIVTEYTSRVNPVGYYSYDGTFVCTNSITDRVNNYTYLADMEIVMQMCSAKNTALTISPEAVIERIGNSNNCSPFVNTNRYDQTLQDIPGNSSRVAACLQLSHRYHAKNTDIYDQVFRRGDRIRLTRFLDI